VVIITSLILIIIGAAILFVDSFNTSGTGIVEKTFSSLFQSVTARTAGFNTVQIGLLKPLSLLSLIVLMFIGGSPGSTAGGVKTTTLVIVLSHTWHGLRGRSDINIFERRIPDEVIRRALVLLTIAILWNLAGVMIQYCS
jgi:trk system potassium uptake protein TrkH